MPWHADVDKAYKKLPKGHIGQSVLWPLGPDRRRLHRQGPYFDRLETTC